MTPLRILSNLTDIQEHNGVALSAALRCSCGGEVFELSHTGKQTKGILAPLIIPRDGQLCVMASCPGCGASVCLYDSRVDGSKPRAADTIPVTPLSMKQGREWQIRVRLNYLPEHFQTDTGVYSNHFENLFVDICQPASDRKYTLFEI